MFTVILVGAVLAAGIWYRLGRERTIARNNQPLPRPPNTLPFFGNGLLFLQARHKLLDWFTRCERHFGFETFEISVPTLPPGIVINDPNVLEYVLRHDDHFCKGEFFRQRSWDLFGNGIINADGQLWKVQRRAGLRFFSNANLKILIDVFLPHFMLETIIQLRQYAETEAVVDLEAAFLELTTRLMGRAAYNMDMKTSEPFSEAFDFASGAIGERFQNPLWPVTELLFGRRFRRAVAEVKAFGQVVVDKAMKRRDGNSCESEQPRLEHGFERENAEGNTDGIRGSLINSLIDDIPDSNVVADAALNFLSAGRDTTAQALTWCFYMLMRQPRVLGELRRELKGIHAGRDGRQLSYERIQSLSMPYTLAVFYETLRLYPPVPFEMKQCIQATVLPDGTSLPTGGIVVWCPWAMGRSKLIWGDNADIFHPERWLYEVEDVHNPLGSPKRRIRTRTQYEFPVFNGGPRHCLGKKMAELQAVYVIATLVDHFDFEEVGQSTAPNVERRSRNSLTLPMEGGLPCRVKISTARVMAIPPAI